MRIAVDMDEVIADTLKGKRDFLERACGATFTDDELAGRKISDVALGEHAACLEEELQRGQLYGSFDLMPGAVEAMRALAGRHEVFIATAAMDYPASLAPKFDWMRDNFPFLDVQNFVFCGDKSVVAADLLIDDSLRHFARFGGRGILFDALHNRGADWPFRLSSWEGAVDRIEAFAAVPGPRGPIG